MVACICVSGVHGDHAHVHSCARAVHAVARSSCVQFVRAVRACACVRARACACAGVRAYARAVRACARARVIVCACMRPCVCANVSQSITRCSPCQKCQFSMGGSRLRSQMTKKGNATSFFKYALNLNHTDVPM